MTSLHSSKKVVNRNAMDGRIETKRTAETENANNQSTNHNNFGAPSVYTTITNQLRKTYTRKSAST